MYFFYLGTMLLPISPESLEIETPNGNKTYNLINEGEVNVLKSTPLKNIKFDFILPVVQYPFAHYKSGFISATVILEYLKYLKESKESFQFVVVRATSIASLALSSTVETVSLESYTVSESTENGLDYKVSIQLKEYNEKSNSLIGTVIKTAVSAVATMTKPRNKGVNQPKTDTVQTYAVRQGDTLWSIAKKYYGEGSLYTKIAKQNKLNDPNKIYVGQKLTIPKKG